MKYNFDEIIHREGTNCVKYDMREKFFGNENVMPLWVADMDFASPNFVRQAIIERAMHPIYGYTFIPEGLYISIINWMQRRHGWSVKKDWISLTPGIVPALNMAVLANTRPGDKIIVQPPVYFPFFSAVKNNDRRLVYNQLKEKNGSYQMDLKDLRQKCDKKTKMLLLCHPQNPIGCVWKKDVLEELVHICEKNNITIVSDEIHSDLMLNKSKHIPLASLSETAAKISITTIAPSKTFNLAGMASSALIIPDPELKKLMDKVIDQVHIGMGNLFGLTAMQVAYEKGDDWLNQLLEYLEGNLELMKVFFTQRIPQIKLYIPESTYMIWLDFRELGLTKKQLTDFVIQKAGLGLNDGHSFGPGGNGFQRMNFALPRAQLLKALEQLEKAVNELGK